MGRSLCSSLLKSLLSAVLKKHTSYRTIVLKIPDNCALSQWPHIFRFMPIKTSSWEEGRGLLWPLKDLGPKIDGEPSCGSCLRTYLNVPAELHQLRGGCGVGSTPGSGQGARSYGGGCVSGWEEGAAEWTPMDQGRQATAWERGGMEAPSSGPQSWYKRLVRSVLSALSKLASTSTCLGLRVLGTCTLWSVPFPWPQRNREAAGKLFP